MYYLYTKFTIKPPFLKHQYTIKPLYISHMSLLAALNSSEKSDFVSWDDEIPNCFWKVIQNSMVWNHQPAICLHCLQLFSEPLRDLCAAAEHGTLTRNDNGLHLRNAQGMRMGKICKEAAKQRRDLAEFISQNVGISLI